MIFSNKRSELEIVAQMLSLAREDVKKTPLMYQTNLCYTHFIEYMDFLLEKGFLGVKNGDPSGKVYYISEKGKKFLDHINGTLKLVK